MPMGTTVMTPLVVLTTLVFRCRVAGEMCEYCVAEFNTCKDQCSSIWMPHQAFIGCVRDCCDVLKDCREQRCHYTYDDYDYDDVGCNTYMFMY